MTASAPDFSTKPISAMTVGADATSLQYVSCPPTLCITLSMSAAVVPGTKLCAITTYGPAAAPLKLKPPPLLAPGGSLCPMVGASLLRSIVEIVRGVRVRSLSGGRLRPEGWRGLRGGGALGRGRDVLRWSGGQIQMIACLGMYDTRDTPCSRRHGLRKCPLLLLVLLASVCFLDDCSCPACPVQASSGPYPASLAPTLRHAPCDLVPISDLVVVAIASSCSPAWSLTSRD